MLPSSFTHPLRSRSVVSWAGRGVASVGGSRPGCRGWPRHDRRACAPTAPVWRRGADLRAVSLPQMDESPHHIDAHLGRPRAVEDDRRHDGPALDNVGVRAAGPLTASPSLTDGQTAPTLQAVNLLFKSAAIRTAARVPSVRSG